jgi:ribosome maturation factor RimP
VPDHGDRVPTRDTALKYNQAGFEVGAAARFFVCPIHQIATARAGKIPHAAIDYSGAVVKASRDPLTERIMEVVEPVVSGMGYELVRVRMTGAKRRVLQIMAERPDGTMDVDDCAEISNALSAALDVADPIQGTYELEVSSPGIDRPLTREKDFVTYAGHVARIEMAVPDETGRKRFRGRIDGLDGNHLRLAVTGADGSEHIAMLALSDMEEAHLVLTDALIESSLRRQKANENETSDTTGNDIMNRRERS